MNTFAEIRLPHDRLEKLVAFGIWLADASQTINLTRILDPEDMAIRHFLDSYQLLGVLKRGSSPVLDVGTGGGVPGLPLAIFRKDLRVVMIDSTQKKIRFVKQWIGELGLKNASALHARAEEHLKAHSYRTLINRAAIKPMDMMETLLRTGSPVNRVVFMEGANGKETARDILAIARRAGYAFDLALPYRLPGLEKERYLLCFQRF